MNTDLTMMKLITVKENETNRSNTLEKVESTSDMQNYDDISTAVSTNEPIKKSLIENGSPSLKRSHKHKHHHHRHRHHCQHHRNRRYRVKNGGQSKTTIIYPKKSDNKGNSTEQTLPSLLTDDQEITNSNTISQSVVSAQNQDIKSDKGNIPLQPIENKLISQRVASTDEAQVGNYCCTQPATSFISACPSQPATSFISSCPTQSTASFISACPTQQVERIYVEEDCCYPAPAITCASTSCTSCVVPQTSSCVCVCQQQQPAQLFLCSDPCTSQSYICSSSCNVIPQPQQQQQFICVDNTSAQPLLCVPQTPNVVFQQPQIQAQPIQILQAPQAPQAQYLKITSSTPQLIETMPSPNMLQPQFIQPQSFVQALAAPAMAASPQILYQRPYDPVVMPAVNHPLAIAPSSALALSQPSYAPARRPGPRMFQHALIRTVANRTGVPVPLHSAGSLALGQSPFANAPGRASLFPAGSALPNDGLQPSNSAPILPLTPGGLLIPFQQSEPMKGMIQGPLPRGSFGSNLRNFNQTRQQIQQRAQLLADLQQRLDFNRTPSLPIRSANTPFPPMSSLPPSGPLAPLGLSPSVPRFPPSPPISSTPGFLSNNTGPFAPSALTPSVPPPIIRSQTPYRNRGNYGTSSSSNSDRSAASSTFGPSSRPAGPSGLIYSQPSFAGSQRGSIISGPSAPYQSLRP